MAALAVAAAAAESAESAAPAEAADSAAPATSSVVSAAPSLPAAAHAATAKPQFSEAGLAQQRQPGYLLNLDEKQKVALAHLRETFKDVSCWEMDHNIGTFALDDRTLLRFLRARDFDIKKATELLQGHVEWRDEWKPSTVTLADIPHTVQQQFNRFIGFSKQRAPIVLYRTELWDHMEFDSMEEIIRTGAYFAERCRALCEPGVEKLIIIFDMANYQFGGEGFARRMKMAKRQMEVTTVQYPETLLKAFLINVPFIFRVAWAVFQLVLPAATKAKVVMHATHEQMLEYIDPSVLTAQYGGTRKEPYDPKYLLAPDTAPIPTPAPTLAPAPIE